MHRTTNLMLPAILAGVLCVTAAPPAAAQTPAPIAGVGSITAEELTGLLKFYSSDWFQGRDAPSPTFDMATDFLASQLAAAGIKPGAPDGSYFQRVMYASYRLADDMALTVHKGRAVTELRPGVDFSIGSMAVPWKSSSPLAIEFVGFGVTSQEPTWDDISGRDLTGKIAVVFDGFPAADREDGPFAAMGNRGRGRGGRGSSFAKVRAVQQAGAVALVVIPNPKLPDRTLVASLESMTAQGSRPNLEARLPDTAFPVITLSAGAANQIFGERVLAAAEQAYSGGNSAYRVPATNITIFGHAEVVYDRIPSQNVVGIWEGTDLKDQYVLMGAHADHTGTRGDQINNGADDDGSGSVTLLEIAEAFASAGARPRRTIVFGWWTGEEDGLLGSWYYSRNPIYPLEKTVALIQMDMIGRNEVLPEDNGDGMPPETAEDNVNSVNMIGYSFSDDMKNLVARANEAIGLKVNYRYDAGSEGLLRRSDHWNFLQLGVPIAFLFTGLHPDYHRPTDTWEKINYPKMARIGQMAFRAAWELATTDTLPKLNPGVDIGGGGR